MDLARHIHVQPPTLARTLTRLQQTGLVKRKVDPKDHRINRLALTAKGEKIVAKVKMVHDAERRDIFSVLSAEEQRQLRSLLDRVSEKFEEHLEGLGK